MIAVHNGYIEYAAYREYFTERGERQSCENSSTLDYVRQEIPVVVILHVHYYKFED